MKRLILFSLAGTLLFAAAEQRTFTGVITDTMCGGDHRAMNVSPDADCVLECIRHDKNNKFALYDGRNVYRLSDQETPAKYAGQRVKVTGTLYEKTKIIKVDSIEPLSGAVEKPKASPGHHHH